MKYFSSLLVVVAILSAGILQAQTPSKLNGQTFTYVMKNINGIEDEIQDVITFENNNMKSDYFAQKGFQTARVLEKDGGNVTNFEVTLRSANEGTRFYKGKVHDGMFEGTIIVTDKDGNQSEFAFRGMTTEQWNGIQEQKRKAREEMMKKQQN